MPQDGPAGSPAPVNDHGPRWFYLLGAGLLLLFAVARLYTNKPADYAVQLLVLMTAVAFWRFRHPLRKSRIFHLFLLALLAQLVTWGLSLWLTPELAESSPKVERLGAWFFLLPVAVFAGGSKQRVFLLWGAALAALMLAPWLSGEGWSEIARGLAGKRVGFGIINEQHTGVLFGLALLGLGIFLFRFQAWARAQGRAWLLVPYTFFMLCALSVVVFAQTRGVWLGLLSTLAVLALVITCRLSGERKTAYMAVLREMRWRVAGVIVLLLVMVTALFSSIIVDRISEEGTPAAVLAGEVEDLSLEGSVRVRLNTWREALHWVGERPVFGWGGNGRSEVVQSSPGLSAVDKGRIRHLHSTYMDTLVDFGFVGLLLWLALLWTLGRAIVRAWRASSLADDFFWFWCAFLVYWLVVNVFESYMYYESGFYLFALVAGACLSLVEGQSAENE